MVVDEAYLRESILNSQAKIVKGFQPLMPTFQGLISEENLVALIEHVKSCRRRRPAAAADGPTTGPDTLPRRRVRRSKPCWTRSRCPERHYLHNGHGLRSWLLTKDHKRIAIMYLMSISVMFFLGGMFGVGIRLELATPQGDFVSADTYNKFFTMHGVIMVFFFLIPSIPAVLGNFLIPPMIGAKDLAFPRINLLSLYIYWIGGIFTLYAMIVGRRRHRLDLLHAVQRDRRRTPTSCRSRSACSSPGSRRF